MRIRLWSTAAALVLLTLSAGTASAHPPGLPLTVGPGGPRTAGFEVVSHVNPGPGTNADVFAYRGRAFLASWVGQGCLSKGIRSYDLRDPRRPRLQATFADAKSDPRLKGTWTEKVIVQRVDTRWFHGDLAVVTFQACDGIAATAFRGFGLYDVSRPTQPRLLALYSAPKTRGSHEIWLGSHAGKAYVYTAVIDSELTTAPDYDPETQTATKPGRADFRIVDVTRPARPRDVGEWGAWRKLGLNPRPGDVKRSFTHSVRVDERLRTAYLSYWDSGTVILDIRNPAKPTLLGRIPVSQDHAHSSALTHGGRWLIETHETAGGLPKVYDISDPKRPWLLSTFTVPGADQDSVHDPKVRGNTVFFSWYGHGIVAADLRDPTDLQQTAQFLPDDPYLNPDYYCEEKCVDVWGVALDDRGYVLASDMNSGLYVLRYRPVHQQPVVQPDNPEQAPAAAVVPPIAGLSLAGWYALRAARRRWSQPNP